MWRRSSWQQQQGDCTPLLLQACSSPRTRAWQAGARAGRVVGVADQRAEGAGRCPACTIAFVRRDDAAADTRTVTCISVPNSQSRWQGNTLLD